MISDRCLEMIKHHEGVRQLPYRCPAKLWTIGVGHVLYPEQARLTVAERLAVPLRGEDDRVWTTAEIDRILEQDLQRFVRGVGRYCPTALAQQGHLDALVSFSFNVGLGTLQRSTLRQKHNRGDYSGAADEFLKYTLSGGKPLKGLIRRRGDERALYLAGNTP